MILNNKISLERLVDSHMRLYNSTRVATRQKLFGLLATIPLLLVALLGYSAAGLSLITWIFILLAIGYVPFFWFTWPMYLRRRMRKYLREAYGDKDELEYEVEFHSDGLRWRLGATEVSFKWSDVSDMMEFDDRFELWIGKQALTVIRRSEFSGSEEYEEWRQLALEKTGRN